VPGPPHLPGGGGLGRARPRLYKHQLVTGEAVHPLCTEVPEVKHDDDRVIPAGLNAVHRPDRFQHGHGIETVQRTL
jgi:hypothetical protein